MPGDQPTIQAGIDAVVNGDDIEADPGIYLETIDFLGKSITVRSVSGDPNDTIIDGTGFDTHLVTCTSGEDPNTVLAGFTITGGNANGAAGCPGQCGGGMLCDGTSPTLINAIIKNNTPNGVINSGGVTTMTYSIIHGGFIGVGNFDTDPLFIDADGADDTIGTADDNLAPAGHLPGNRRRRHHRRTGAKWLRP